MSIFITGLTGFVGQVLARELLNHPEFRNAKIYGLVRQPRQVRQDLLSKIHILEGDSQSLLKHQTIIQECEYIFHIGARASLGNGSQYEEDNIQFTNRLISLAQKSQKLKRFVFTSTIGAVDRQAQDDCSQPLTEESRANPLSDYGKSKLKCEEDLKRSGIPYVIVRPAWVYGPGMRGNSHVRVFIDAVAGGKLFVKFNFPGRISLIHVQDLARALVFLALHPKSVHGIYFAADLDPLSLGDLFKKLGKLLGKPSSGQMKIPFGIPILMRKYRAHFPLVIQNLFSDVLCASSAKLQALGFSFQWEQGEGLRSTAHWHFSESLQKQQGNQNLAVVTGGASGIGRALAEQLYAYGYEIAIMDRDVECEMPFPAQVLAIDLAAKEGREKATRFCRENAAQIALWVNNAGIGKRGSLTEIGPDDLERMIDTNCKAVVLLSQTALSTFQTSGRGTLINIGSSSGFQPLPYMAVYGASKAFVIHFSQAVSGEITSKNIHILTISPSGTATQFQKTAGVKEDDRNKLLTPQKVASEILHLTRVGRGTYVIGNTGKLMALAARFTPSRLQVPLWAHLMKEMR